MLKGLFYIFLGIMLACSCNSKSKKQNEQEVNTPTSVNDSNTIAKIEFPQKSFNFGDLQEGEIVTHTFRFKNTGTKSLVILNVEASCGCTTPKYDKKPIPPGGEGKIEVEFNSSGRYGKQYKAIFMLTLQQTATQGNAFMQFLPLILIVVVFWFFMIRPQMKRQKELKKYRDELKKGDKVMTTGGIFGKIVEINDFTVIIEVESQARLKVSKEAIVKDMTDVPASK